MTLLRTLIRLRDRNRLESISRELAVGVGKQVVRAVLPRAAGMSPAEARGYVRAKSGPFVQARIQSFVNAHPTFPKEARTELAELVTNSIVALVTRDLLARQSAVAPASAEPLRRAA